MIALCGRRSVITPFASILIAWLSMICPSALRAQSTSTKPAIIAYVFPQNGVVKTGEIAAKQLTRINYAFANVKDGKIIEGFSSTAENLAALNMLKQQNPTLTVLVSVGGWTWSGNFSDAALTPSSRALFIESAVVFVEKYNIDGVDIDWEYPGSAGAGNSFRADDKVNYTLLLKEMRARFDREQTRLHRPLFLTIATGASKQFLSHTEMQKVQQYVDTVNLMAYDYYTPGSKPNTGNHAPLFVDPADPQAVSAAGSVQAFEEAGVPAAKIVLGVPFYGHTWAEVPDVNHGLFQPGKAAPKSYAQYADIVTAISHGGFTRYWDVTSSAPYLYSPTTSTFISYEDSESLTRKTDYVLEHRLGGVMFWDYEGDPSGTLLKTIHDGLTLAPTQK
jgi:chitinase